MEKVTPSALPGDSIPDAMLPTHRFYDPVPGLSGEHAAAFAYSSDRLVRHLFDVGLQLRTMQAVFDRDHATPEEIRAASDTVGAVLNDLNVLISDAGLAMLALNSATTTTGSGNGQTTHRRRRRR
ncbi:hypothetical protein [Nocardia sp. NPDC051570]|uniref:hypothetical protein n=1 Tax=Nocardia sp. NPDC051570 TaxID=3364324 RepID=UPI0037B9E67C